MAKRWADKDEFKERVRYFADRMDVPIRSLTVRPMRTKWASCSTNGVLTFNTELLEMERDIGDYVIVHELMHFHVPHHRKLWKSLMTAYVGDYEAIEQRLNQKRALV